MFSLEKGNADYGLSFIICCKLNVAHFIVCILIFFLFYFLGTTKPNKQSKEKNLNCSV